MYTECFCLLIQLTYIGFPGSSVVEIPQVQSLGQEDPLEKGMATLLLWKPHGLGRLAGYSPWGHKELNATERLKNNNI